MIIIYLVHSTGSGLCVYVSSLSFQLLWKEKIPPIIMSPSLNSWGFSASPLCLHISSSAWESDTTNNSCNSTQPHSGHCFVDILYERNKQLVVIICIICQLDSCVNIYTGKNTTLLLKRVLECVIVWPSHVPEAPGTWRLDWDGYHEGCLMTKRWIWLKYKIVESIITGLL